MRAWWVVLCLTGCLEIGDFGRGLTVEETTSGIVIDGRRFAVGFDPASGMPNSLTIANQLELLERDGTGGFGIVIDQDNTNIRVGPNASSTGVSSILLAGPVVAQVDTEWTVQFAGSPVTGKSSFTVFPDGRIVRHDNTMESITTPRIRSFVAIEPSGSSKAVSGDGICTPTVVPDTVAGARWSDAKPAGELPSAVTPNLEFDLTCAGTCSNWELTTSFMLAGPDVFDASNADASIDCPNQSPALLAPPAMIDIGGQPAPLGFRDGIYTAPNAVGMQAVTVTPPAGGFPKGVVLAIVFPAEAAEFAIDSEEVNELLVQRNRVDGRVFFWIGNKVDGAFTITPN